MFMDDAVRYQALKKFKVLVYANVIQNNALLASDAHFQQSDRRCGAMVHCFTSPFATERTALYCHGR